MPTNSQPNDDRERTDGKELSDEELDAVSGGRGITLPQPTSDRRKRRTAGSTAGDDPAGTDSSSEGTITTGSGIVIDFEDGEGTSTPPESSTNTTPQQDDVNQTDGATVTPPGTRTSADDNEIQTQEGIVIGFEDDGGGTADGNSTDDASNQDDTGGDSTSAESSSDSDSQQGDEDATDDRPIRTRQGIVIDFDDDA